MASAKGNEHRGARAQSVGEVEFDAGVDFAIVAAVNASRFECVLQEFGFGDQVNAAHDGEPPGGGPAG